MWRIPPNGLGVYIFGVWDLSLGFRVSVLCFMRHLRGHCHRPYGVAALRLNVVGVAADACGYLARHLCCCGGSGDGEGSKEEEDGRGWEASAHLWRRRG